MKNRITNAWDSPHLPEEVKRMVHNRTVINASAARAILPMQDVMVTIREYDNPHPDGSVVYRNVALFVGPIQVICLDSTKLNRNKEKS